MKNRLRFVLPFLVLIVLTWAATKIFAPGKPRGIFEGYVEGDLVQIGPIEGERLKLLTVQPGAQVTKGELLFKMDTPVLDELRTEAKAKVEQAQATLANLKAAMNRPEQIAVLKASLERAKASLVLSRTEYERQAALLPKGATTVAARDQAKFALDRDKAAVAEAKRQIEAALLPSRSNEIDAAQAALLQAKSQVQQIDTRIARQSVHAPAAGIIQDVYFWPGEMVNAGQPILALLPPENRKVRFYVPETQLAKFSLGKEINVSCDNCGPGFRAHVIYISQQAEFTPPVIFSLDERGKLVFRIDARPDDKNLKLPPLGQPVTVRFVAPEAASKAAK